MNTLVGLMLAVSPIVLTAGLLVAADRRQRRVQARIERQIALTDALHRRLGALVAPVVRGQRRAWTVEMAVPMEQPAVVTAVLAAVEEVFGRVAYEVRLRRQVPPVPVTPARCAAVAVRELSWT
jgi:hypothetical protein